MKCRNCRQPVRRTLPGDGVDPRDFEWVHDDGIGNPLCDMGFPSAEPDGSDEEDDPRLAGWKDVTPVRGWRAGEWLP